MILVASSKEDPDCTCVPRCRGRQVAWQAKHTKFIDAMQQSEIMKRDEQQRQRTRERSNCHEHADVLKRGRLYPAEQRKDAHAHIAADVAAQMEQAHVEGEGGALRLSRAQPRHEHEERDQRESVDQWLRGGHRATKRVRKHAAHASWLHERVEVAKGLRKKMCAIST
eukprot:6192687-Pleurochrysis_carterae.AAC.3